MKIFNEILDKHTKIYNCERESYMINEDTEILISQEGKKVVMWGVNHKTDKYLNLSTKRFKKLMDGFKSVASDLYSSGNSSSTYYYINLDTSSNKDVADSKDYELEIEELKKKVACLNDIIDRLENYNKKLESDVDKYREDYLHYFDKYAELRDKDFNRTLEDMNQLKKNSLMHNARGAGRKSKFSDAQVDEIRRLREDGSTIKEIASRFECSVGLIHKLINENKDANN